MATCETNINISEKTIPISTEEAKSNRCKIMKFLIEKSGIPGITPERAAGFCGNMFGESGYNPNAINPSSKAYGLCQWLGQRKTKLKNFAASNGKPIDDLEVQLNYLVSEITGSYYKKNCWDKVLAAENTVANATRLILRHFEVPGRTNAEADAVTERDAPIRTKYANKALAAYNNGNCDNNVGF